jgi:hypothetical protein
MNFTALVQGQMPYTLLTERHVRKLQIPSPSFLKLETSKLSKRDKATVSLHNSPGLLENRHQLLNKKSVSKSPVSAKPKIVFHGLQEVAVYIHTHYTLIEVLRHVKSGQIYSLCIHVSYNMETHQLA